MKIEREIDQVKYEVQNDKLFEKLFIRKYEFENWSSEYDFPICKGCGNELSSNDLLKLFPEKEDEINQIHNYLLKLRKLKEDKKIQEPKQE